MKFKFVGFHKRESANLSQRIEHDIFWWKFTAEAAEYRVHTLEASA